MAASIYVTQFTATKQKEFNNLLTIGNGDNSKEVVFSVNEQDSRQIYDTITKALDKYNGNMYSISVDNNNFTKYVYCNDVELFNNICLSDGRFFESDEKNSSLFLSTLKSNDIKQIGVIKSFENEREFKIKTLASDLNENSFKKTFTIVFDSDEKIGKFRNELKENEIYFDTIDNNSYQIKYMTFYVIVFGVFYTALIIILLYDLLNSYKKIGIQKMLGFSNFDIWKNRICSIMKTIIIVFGISIVVFSLILFKQFNSLVLEFITRIFIYYLLIIGFTFIFCSLPFLYVRKIKISNMLKNDRPTNAIICLNTVLKIIMTTVFLTVSIYAFSEFSLLNSGHNDKYQNWEKTKNYVTNSVIEYDVGTEGIDSFSEENIEKCYNLYMSLNKKGGILAKFDKYRISDEKYKSGIEYKDNNIIINPNYLKSNAIYDLNGKKVEISEQNHNCIVLVPEKFKSEEENIIKYYKKILLSYESNSTELTKEIQIIWIRDGQKFFSYRIDINPNENSCVENPLVMVITEANANKLNFLEVLGTGNFLMKVSDQSTSSAEVNNEIGKYYDLSTYHFPLVSVYDSMNEKITESKSMIVSYSIMLSVLVVLICVVIIQNVANYFEQNKKRLAIQKFMGFKLKDKYLNYFVSDVCSLIISFCLAWAITKRAELFVLSIVVLIIELIFTIVLLVINENRNVLRLTKGG